jgi:peptidoglycan/LPS O-acetylase OafA/YrhL
VRQHVRSGTEVFDGLRGLAILLVVAFHTWLFSWYMPDLTLLGHSLPVAMLVRGGYLGVDLFFMISCFVLFFPYAERALGGSPPPTLREFARRRFLKIVPSYALALAATAVLAIPVVQSTPALLGSLANHVFFFQNAFDDRMGSVNSVLWSLAVEVQFYLIFPLLAIAFVRRPFVVAGLMIAAAVLYRYAVAPCCIAIEPVTRQLPAFLDVFACGMAAAYALVWLRARVPRLERFAPLFTLAALACLGAGFALYESADGFAYAPSGSAHWLLGHRTWLALDSAAFGVASCLAAGWWRRVVANPVFLFLGIVSYNLYLWHTLVLIWIWRHGVLPAATPEPHDDPQWRIPFILVGWTACLAISTAITYFIERPLLGTARRPTFSFDWQRLQRWSISPSETRTGTSTQGQIRNQP